MREIEIWFEFGSSYNYLSLCAQGILEEAQSDANKLSLRRQTEAAQARGIFGAPTFFVGDEMFWCDDRLDDALAHGMASPS
jgi:2-hydroxychromene-2-carboxylate isomerase